MREEPRPQRGLTLVELLVAVVLLGVLVAVAAPSMRDMIARQRVRAINAELVTDLQFARSEAARMNRPVLISFENNASQSCYTLYVRGVVGFCSCSRGAGNACRFGPTEIKTVQVPRSRDISITAVSSEDTNDLAFSAQDGMLNHTGFTIDVASSVHGKLRTTLNMAGRVSSCTPDGSISGVTPC